jgi:hypothetical protein
MIELVVRAYRRAALLISQFAIGGKKGRGLAAAFGPLGKSASGS